MKILTYGQDDALIFSRPENRSEVAQTVTEVLQAVSLEGDAALKRYSSKFDRCSLESFEVSPTEIEQAVSYLDPAFVEILKKAAVNIVAFHQRQTRSGFEFVPSEGIVLGQRVLPLDRVGVYVPGGTASYPSSVLMNVIPARIAGVKEIVVTSPPDAEGKVKPAILAAAKLAGAHRIFKVGGAQAIAALAYGTETVPAVDKIVGPGNAYVAEAKKQVFGQVGIDMIAGPSEILIVADSSANAVWLAADLLSQAEHDKLASAWLVTDDRVLAQEVAAELVRQTELLPRKDIARQALESFGKIILVNSPAQALEVANRFAPEHLELCVADPFVYLPEVRHAGSVFLGHHCPEAVGDYFAGPNHTLPTMGTARFASPLSVEDFTKKSSYAYYTLPALRQAANDIVRFAEEEGLSAHANSVKLRLSGQETESKKEEEK